MGYAPFTNTFWDNPFLSRLYEFLLGMNSIYFKIFIYVHKNPLEPQAPDHLEKLAESLLYNYHREHILLKFMIKKLSRNLDLKKFLQLEFSGLSITLHDVISLPDATSCDK